MDELEAVVRDLKPDKFTPTLVKRTDDYIYAEYQSPIFGVRGLGGLAGGLGLGAGMGRGMQLGSLPCGQLVTFASRNILQPIGCRSPVQPQPQPV
jgi:hypothetical protein